MKKLIALLLTMMLALSLCGILTACGEETPTPAEKTPLEQFADVVANTKVSTVDTEITMVVEGKTLTIKTKLNSKTNSITYQSLNHIDPEGENPDFMTGETLAAKSGENTVTVGTLTITAENLSDVKIEDGILTAKVTNVSGFFGTDITTFTSAQVTMSAQRGFLTDMTVTYTTTEGCEVTMTVDF